MRWSCNGALRWAASAAALIVSGCMLGNINPDACGSDAECEGLFGLGSTCDAEGYCSEAASCTTSVECRASFGFGASCDGSQCVIAQLEPRCQLSEPESLLYELPGRLGDRILLGGLFAIDTEKHRVRADATRLAIRQINNIAGGIMGRPLGILICNTDSDGDSSNDGQETEELTQYLAGTLGVPVILGPTSSSASIAATNLLLQHALATAIISPSATSSQLSEHPDRLHTTDPYGLFWRTCPSDALQGRVLARVIARQQIVLAQVVDGLDTVAVIYQNDAYGTGLQLEFRTEFESLAAGHSVSGFSFEVDSSNLTTAVGAAAAAAPDAVLVISSDAGRTVSVLDAASQQSALVGLPYFLTDGSKDSAVLLSPTNPAGVTTIVQNAIGTAPASPAGPSFDVFEESLRNEFNAEASQFSFVAHSYDAAYVGSYGIVFGTSASPLAFDGTHVVEGLSRLAGGHPVAVGTTDFSAAVTELSSNRGIDITGTSGPLDFNAATGEAPGDVEVWSVQTGTTWTFQTIHVASADEL